MYFNVFKNPFQNVCSGNLFKINTKNTTSRSRVTKHPLMWLLAFLSPGHEEIFVLLRNSDHALAIQSVGKFFIYEHYDLSPLVVLFFLCKLFEAALKLLKI